MASALEQFVNNVRTLSLEGNFTIKEFFLTLFIFFVTSNQLFVANHFLIDDFIFLPANFKELSNIVGKYNDVLVKNHQHLDNVLETLDLEFHTIGILAVLNAKLVHMLTTNLNLEIFKPVLSQLQEFITSCNREHVKYVLELCEKLEVLSLKFLEYSLQFDFHAL